MIAFLFLTVCFVAFTNGANANFKGVASLYGTGTLSRRQALYWGTAATLAGSIAAFFLAEGRPKDVQRKGRCARRTGSIANVCELGRVGRGADKLSRNEIRLSRFDDTCIGGGVGGCWFSRQRLRCAVRCVGKELSISAVLQPIHSDILRCCSVLAFEDTAIDL